MQLGLKAAELLDDPSSDERAGLELEAAIDGPSKTLRRLGEGGIRVAPAAHLGERIGPYRILETLGEGGMGIVYLAEQEQPFRRRVALKVIKLGMDTHEVVARFEGERQALAMMGHSHIAQIYGAGVTDDGRPYFVMEHVSGMPITEYCDHNEMSTRARLELFMLVCRAIEHAHQKGIIHRDIKPHNILVTVQDGRPVPKVIDFGVAKATRQRLTEKTVFTHLGLLIGTPEYMSPEQAELGRVDITSSTDVYSLGVLLYELLVSALPFDPTLLHRAGYAEIQRIIHEDLPLPPSTRLSGFGDKGADTARRRRTDLSSLVRELRGDLDWIALRALEKKPEERYPSAAALADDVSRHLTNERVLARPSSLGSSIRRFTRRHRFRSRATAAVAVLLTFGAAAISGWVATRGPRLTVQSPIGGTLIGAGLVCGTHGTVCSAKLSTARVVELFPVADPGYVFAGFRGDCAPSGHLTMTSSRVCGASFERARTGLPSISHALTVETPAGGTLVSPSGILCGTQGSQCAAALSDGVPVILRAIPDADHRFVTFTGACTANGETVMTVDRVCGATFTPTAQHPRGSEPRQARTSAPAAGPSAFPSRGIPKSSTEPAVDDLAPAAQIRAEAEIQKVIDDYCTALQTLQSGRIKQLMPTSDERLYDQLFRQYASLTCSLTTPVTHLRLDTDSMPWIAVVTFGMRQEIAMKVGGPSRTLETLVTMFMSKTSSTDRWLIDKISHSPKP